MTPEQSMTFCFILPNLDPCMLRIKHPSAKQLWIWGKTREGAGSKDELDGNVLHMKDWKLSLLTSLLSRAVVCGQTSLNASETMASCA